MTTLLQKMNDERAFHAERLRLSVREQLREAVREILPGTSIVLFGSLTKPGSFSDDSDVDIALATEPATMTVYQLIARLSERLGRRVDVVLLPESRLREKILREGESWTL